MLIVIILANKRETTQKQLSQKKTNKRKNKLDGKKTRKMNSRYLFKVKKDVTQWGLALIKKVF